MVTGDKPDEQVDWSQVQKVIDAATREEQVPLVCSVPGCREKPVLRWSPTPDVTELVCARDAVMVGVHLGTAEFVSQLSRHGFVIAGDTHLLIRAIGDALMEEMEVLS